MARIVTSLAVIIYLAVCTTAEFGEDTWSQEKKNHKSSTLSTKRMKTLVEKSDPAYFKKVLLDPILKERVSGTPANAQVRQHIIDTMNSFAWTVEEDAFDDDTPFGRKHFVNVIATVNPSAPRKLTLAAHYDSKYFSNIEFIGATDSAVPCAMMLDLARALNDSLWQKQSARYNHISLQFIFFDGEEAFKEWTATDSIYGARHLAEMMERHQTKDSREYYLTDLQRMDCMVLLDLIGAPNPRFRNWFDKTSHLFERLKKIEQRLARQEALQPAAFFTSKTGNNVNRYFVGSQAFGGIEDDHIPFLHRKVPILHLITYPFPEVWHKEGDNANIIDYDTVDNLNKILRVFVAEYLHLSP